MKDLVRISCLAGIAAVCAACGIDPEHRYTIVGDINGVIDEGDKARIVVRQSGFDENGKTRGKKILNKRIRNGIVDLEGEVEEPTAVTILVEVRGVPVANTIAIVEPYAEIELQHLDRKGSLIADGTGRHSDLVANWMVTHEFKQKYEELLDARDVFTAEFEAKRKADSNESKNGTGDDGEGAESVANIAPFEGDLTCPEESLDSESEANAQDEPDHVRLARELTAIQNNALDDLARDSSDPINALLAFELGGLARQHDALDLLDELAKNLDEEVVARRVTPWRAPVERWVRLLDADEKVKPGRNAPEFTTPDLDGEMVSLYSLVADNEVVLLDFWASWCGPCIKTFPDLKEIYADYRDKGFEIVALSVDSDTDDWEDSVVEHETPWVNLGEIVEEPGPISESYGVMFIPKGFVLDSKGCIVQKDLTTDQLRSFLATRLGDLSTEHALESEPAERTDG